MKGQCPSCGGDCGHTKAKGCQYGKKPKCSCEHWQVCAVCNPTRHAEVQAIRDGSAFNPKPNVVPGGFKKSALSALQKTIKREVLEYAGRISLAEAIGVLEIIKHDLIEEHRE